MDFPLQNFVVLAIKIAEYPFCIDSRLVNVRFVPKVDVRSILLLEKLLR